MQPLSFTLVAVLSLALSLSPTHVHAAEVVPPDVVAQRYSLTTSTSLPFPTATQSSSDTESFLASQWGLGKARVQDNPGNVEFASDPYPSNSAIVSSGVQLSGNGPVLQVTYPKGSYSHETGGTQFYNLWNLTNGQQFQSMMLTYELAFEDGFEWNKGGKLPGLRGGLNSTGCSGGNQPTGDCFSARLMWRKNANGEVYAYIPTSANLCDRKDTICNADFGTSFNRGTFGFVTGRWSRVTIVVQLNNPPNVANGQILLYYNDELAAQATELQIRSSDAVGINGLFFSTFFGGNDDSWATPETVHAYFRNIQMWGSEAPSALTGPEVKNAGVSRYQTSTAIASVVLGMVAAFV